MKAPVATKDFVRLHLGYTPAHTAYMTRVRSISDACQHGERPPDGILRTEQTAFNELVNAREAFFDTLLRHGKPPPIPR